MRLIAHISDLHFGRHDAAMADRLLADLVAHKPDLVAISGDLTQRARHREFAAARAFLDRLPAPFIAVPGNHDVPLFDLARRAFRPLTRFARYIDGVEHPAYADGEIAVLGLSTARRATISEGRISHDQLAVIRRFFAETSPEAFRILVTHHPLVAPPHAPTRRIVGRAGPALVAIGEVGIELLLTGHHHRTFGGDIVTQPLTQRRSILVSEAGTAISTRLRDEANGYTLIRIVGREVEYCERGATADGFATRARHRFAHDGERWVRRG